MASYWVAGTSEDCGKRFWSCNLGRYFSEQTAWTKDQPDGQGPSQCVLLNVNIARTRLNVGNCLNKERFICEVCIFF